jgi:hypothetical protein
MKKKKILLFFERKRNGGQRTDTPCLDLRLCLARVHSRFPKAIKAYSMLPKPIQGVLEKIVYFLRRTAAGNGSHIQPLRESAPAASPNL